MTDKHTPHPEVLIPVEQLPLTYFGSVVLAVRRDDGRIYLSLRDLCAALTITLPGQRRRIRDTATLAPGLIKFRVRTPSGRQETDCFVLERVPTWLLGINTRKVDESVRTRLQYLQDYLVKEVYAAFASLAGLPTERSADIEDLADLQRLDTTLEALAERQAAMEASQEHARIAWRDLQQRVTALEQRDADSVLSPAQRGTIYHLVQAWAEARIAHGPKASAKAAYAACWGQIHQRYLVARYEDIPTRAYQDCVAFVQQQYTALTGEILPVPEQHDLGI